MWARLAAVVLACCALLLSMFLLASCGGDTEESSVVRILYAGSLIIPFGELEKEFEAQHPEVDIQAEAHGSIQVLRHVSDIHEQADVLISADSQLIPMLLYDSKSPTTGQVYADWDLEFASNQMVIAYTPNSKFAGEINTHNWFEIVNRPGVRLGIADPRFDANGYRALMMFELTGRFMEEPTLFFDTFEGCFKYPITTVDDNGQTVIHVPEVLETTSDSHVVLRAYSVQLIPLLETGTIDYAIEYLSVIKQHGLQYVPLAPELDLGDEGLNDFYGKVRVDLDFQRFKSVKPSFKGQVITYGLTIPSDAPNPEKAQQFIAFMLGPEGRAIMERNSHPIFGLLRCDHPEKLPEDLAPLLGSRP